MDKMDKVIDRVRKLLAKANGTENEHEAMAFLEKAQTILAEHNLSISDVAEQKQEQFAMNGSGKQTDSVPWIRRIAVAVAEMYFCKYFYTHVYNDRPGSKFGSYKRTDQHTFVGAPHNIAVAQMMFYYLIGAVDRLARQGAKNLPPKESKSKYLVSFRHACSNRLAHRIYDRIQQLKKGGEVKTEAGTTLPALASLYEQTLQQVDDFLKSQIELKAKKSKYTISSVLGAMDGVKAGNEIGLDAQVTGNASAHLIGHAK